MIREFLRHGSNLVLALSALLICFGAALGFFQLTPLWIVAGVLLFYSSEYTFHRFLFHAQPWTGFCICSTGCTTITMWNRTASIYYFCRSGSLYRI